MHVAQHENLAGFRDANLLAAVQLVVNRRVRVFEQAIQWNAFHQSGSDFAARIGRRLRTAHQHLGARILAEAFSPGQRIQQRHRAHGLKRERLAHRAHHRDRPAVIFRHRHFYHRVHQNLFGLERLHQRAFHIPCEQACGFYSVCQHRKMDGAIRFHTNSTGKLRRIVDRNSDKIVNPQLLRRQILPAGFLHELRAHLRHGTGGDQCE